MAGDWIKMRTALANDPAVIAIAAGLDKSEFEVVGMLHHVWSWADSQTENGHIKRVTQKWLDRFVHCDGFAKEMELVSWLTISEAGITFPKFDKHNGESAKKRAEATDRKRKSRENKEPENVTDMSQVSCDKNETREEKRREEHKDQDLMSSDKPNDVRVDYEEIKRAFQQRLPAIPQPRDMTEPRRKAIRSIIKRGGKYSEPGFMDRYFEYVSKSDFLMGRGHNPWSGCTFDWLLKPSNFQKVIEGNYHPEKKHA